MKSVKYYKIKIAAVYHYKLYLNQVTPPTKKKKKNSQGQYEEKFKDSKDTNTQIS